MENLTGGTPPVRYLLCVVPCKLYFEPGETKEQALIRECREELGITIAVGEPFMEVTHTYPDLTVHLSLFHSSIVSGEPQLLEHADLRWITVNEIDQYPFCPADVEILHELKLRF